MKVRCTFFENEILWLFLKPVRKTPSHRLHKTLQSSVCIMIDRRGKHFNDPEVIKITYPNKDQLAEVCYMESVIRITCLTQQL